MSTSLDRGQPGQDLFAAIDLGSNSFHMLVVKKTDFGHQTINRIRKKVRLAGGLDGDLKLSLEAMEIGWDCLAMFADRLADIPLAQVKVAATATLRLAKNSDDFLAKAEQVLGHKIQVIAGETEAKWIYQGATQGLPRDSDNLVIDIGGASTEIIVGTGVETHLAVSLNMGCVTFMQRFFAAEQLTAGAYNSAVAAAKHELASVKNTFQQYGWQRCLGASGTPQALQEIRQASSAYQNIDHNMLARLGEQVSSAYDLANLNITGLRENRRAVFPAGLAILTAIFEELQIQQIELASGALREAMLAQLLGSQDHHQMQQKISNSCNVDQAQVDRVFALASTIWRALPKVDAATNPFELLRLACQYHEIGKLVSYRQFYQHNQYILHHTSMPYLSEADKKLLINVVGNLGDNLQTVADGVKQSLEQSLTRTLRLAYLFMLRREFAEQPPLALKLDEHRWQLGLPEYWLQQNPWLYYELQQEQAAWQKAGWTLELTGE